MTASAPHHGPTTERRDQPGWRGGATRRRRHVGALLLAAGVALVGCGTEEAEEETEGLAAAEPAVIEEEARAAAEEAESLRLSGSVVVGETTFRLDMRVGPDGGLGEVSTDGMNFELLRVEDDLYIKADAGFWQLQQPDDADNDPDVDPAETLEGMYVAVAPEDPSYEQLIGFTDKSVLLDGLLAMEGARETGERGEVDGVETVEVIADGGAGGRLEVALEGPSYPLVLERGGEAGEVRMDGWNEDFTLRPPEDDRIVDYGDDLITSVEGDG